MISNNREKIKDSNIRNQRWLVPAIIYLIAAIIIIITGYFYYTENKATVFEKTQSQLQTLNDLKLEEIQKWYRERDNDIAFYRQNTMFLQEVNAFLSGSAKNKQSLKQWLSQTQASHGYDIFIIEKNGTSHFIIGNDSIRLSQHVVDTCVNSMRSDEPIFLDVYRRENTNKLFYSSIGKLKLNGSESVAACLVFRTNLSMYFIDDIIFDETHSYNVTYSMIRNEGDSVYFVNSKKYTTIDSLAGGHVTNVEEAPLVMATKGVEGTYIGIGPDSKNIIASVKKIPQSNWVLAVHTELDRVEQPLAEKKWIIGIYSLLFILIFILWHLRFVQKTRVKNLHEQIRLNNELINNREILQTIIQSSPLPLIVISREKKILIWNSAATEIFGWSYSEILKGINPLFIAGDDTEYNSILENLDHTVNRYTYETSKKVKNGNIIHLRCWVSNLIDPINKENNLLFVCEDISERKQISDELKRLNENLEQRVNERTIEVADLNRSLTDRANQLEMLNKELESFTYSVSHDLKAPLRSIQGFTDIILNEYVDELSDEVIRLFGIVKKNARRMDQLIKDLLDLSRVTRLNLNFVSLNMNEIIDEVVNDNFSAYMTDKVDLDVNTLLPAAGDKTLIQQVWSNLVSNAIKYSQKSEAPKIKISSEVKGKCIVYSIKDNGVGFNPEYAHKLFNTFQRLHSSDEFEGTGVGLAIVKRIVNRHGGEIWAESEENKGAVFYFTLPATVEGQQH